ncbi:MAG: dihydropteroate synthase [Rhizobiales bacterium]|nr:dihydropteroate synthase [Hyphomicrobiales bacterium]
MTVKKDGLIVIGENVNATRKLKPSSPRILLDGNVARIRYINAGGDEAFMDVSEVFPWDEEQRKKVLVPHVSHAIKTKNVEYIGGLVAAQERAGATIIDVCVDEIAVDPEERNDWMRWLLPAIQKMTDKTLAIDSSDPETIKVGLDIYDQSISRPAINSVNLEPGRDNLIPLAKEYNALLFANGSGREAMPADDKERVENMKALMGMMDDADIPMDDRYLDPLVFPLGAGPDYGNHYLDAVRTLHEAYPDVHIFGGHSNISFGLPKRIVFNHAFLVLCILAGCDTLMIDPIVNLVPPLVEFKLAADALLANDPYGMNYIKYCRAQAKAAAAAANA